MVLRYLLPIWTIEWKALTTCGLASFRFVDYGSLQGFPLAATAWVTGNHPRFALPSGSNEQTHTQTCKTSVGRSTCCSAAMCVYVYIYIYVHMQTMYSCVFLYIHTDFCATAALACRQCQTSVNLSLRPFIKPSSAKPNVCSPIPKSYITLEVILTIKEYI